MGASLLYIAFFSLDFRPLWVDKGDKGHHWIVQRFFGFWRQNNDYIPLVCDAAILLSVAI